MGGVGAQQQCAIEPTASASSAADHDIPRTSDTDKTSENGTERKKIVAADIPSLLADLTAPGASNQQILLSARGFRRMLTCESNPPVKQVVESGVLPLLVQLLSRNDDPAIQFEASWALTNVASTDMTHTVVECEAVPQLVSLLKNSPNADVREQSAWCLGNIAGDCPSLRDHCLAQGAMEPFLMNIAEPASKSLLQNVVWALSNLCRGKPQPDLSLVAPAIPHLSSLLVSDNSNCLMDAVWALSYLSDGGDDRIQAVMNGGTADRLVALLAEENATVVTPALRTLGNFVSGNDSQTQAVLDAGVTRYLSRLLNHGKKNVRKETCWLLSNIAAGTKDQIGALMSMPSEMAAVISMAKSGEWEVKKEATWVLSNIATGGTDSHIEALVELNGIESLCSVLTAADARIVSVALEAIENILQAGRRLGKVYESFVDEADGLDHIEGLQEHANDEIYEKAVRIIETFFGTEEVEDENLAPMANGDTFSFGLPTIKNVDGIDGEDIMAQQPLQPFNFQM